MTRRRIVTLTTTSQPTQAADWSRALMAQAAGVSASTVGRVGELQAAITDCLREHSA
jgi:hypothetical protein